jgi:hypothetical protein
MAKLVLHIFHGDPASLATGVALAERLQQAPQPGRVAFEVYLFGPAEGALSACGQSAFNAGIDRLVKADARVVACIGLAQQAGAEAALRSRGIALESAAVAFPRYAAEGATVITF